jgi:RNA polymerase sigma-70 factor (ECF subfamily)
LRVLGDLTVEQTAAVIGKSPGAVKPLQRRGLEAVQRSITNEGATVWPVVALNE